MQRNTSTDESMDDLLDTARPSWMRGNNIIDTNEFLHEMGFDEPTRSVRAADLGLGRTKPQYRSVDLSERDLHGVQVGLVRTKPQYRSLDQFEHNSEALNFTDKPSAAASCIPSASLLGDSIEARMASLQYKFAPPQKPAARAEPKRAPAFSRRLPQLLSSKFYDVDTDYDSLLGLVRAFAHDMNNDVFDFNLKEGSGYVEGKWCGGMEEIAFSINIYEVTPTQHKLEFVRRAGSSLAYHEFLNVAKRVILQEEEPFVVGLSMPGEIGGLHLDVIDVDEECVEEWVGCLVRAIPEVAKYTLQIIAKAASQAVNTKLMCGSHRLVEQLFVMANSGDRTNCRYSVKALYCLIDAGLELPPHRLKDLKTCNDQLNKRS